MTSLLEIHPVIDSVVAELLQQTEIDEPPVNAFLIARRLGWETVFNAKQIERGRLKRIHDRTTIMLKPDDRPERVQWALAHELGESLSERWSDWINESEHQGGPAARESLATLFANRLLVPENWLRSAVGHGEYNLNLLKQTFCTASHHLISMRLLDLESPLIVTIIDQGEVTTRRSNWLPQAPPLQPAERTCWQEGNGSNRPSVLREGNMSIECWPVHEPDWKREILLTRPLDFDAN